LIVSLDKNKIIKKIREIYNLNKEKKLKLSKKCKKISKEFEENKRLKEFKDNFWNLIKEIENERKK